MEKRESIEYRKELALNYHRKGYNCAQSVICAFEDVLDVPKKELFKVAEAFGFGMGSMGTCGAVTAMALAVGILESDGNMEKPGTKKNSYRAMKSLYANFNEKNGSVVCSEIKGGSTGKVLRSCNGCIEDAVELIWSYMLERNKGN